MQLISREKLKAVLTGPSFDPDSTMSVEMAGFADSILADAPPEVTHFVYSDSSDGEDPEVRYPEYRFYPGSGIEKKELIPQSDSNNGYWGLSLEYGTLNPDDRVYYCYLGGSPLNSAGGFALAACRQFAEQ